MDQLIRAIEGASRWSSEASFESIVLSLLLAFVLGQALAWIYAWSHSGLSYSRSFTQSLVLMTIVVSLVMSVIGNSIITAFGLLGALALVRFRNVLKDTRDTVFVFISLVVGMAVGSQRFLTAILGAVALALAVLYLDATAFGAAGGYDGYLTCRLGAPGGVPAELQRHLQRFCRSVKEISSRYGSEAEVLEVVYRIGLRDRQRGAELLAELRRTAGVEHASLVLRSELSEV